MYVKATPRRRVLYLPLEIKARELLGKTFLAAKAVERGWAVVFGQIGDTFRASRVGPPGAVVEMSIPERKAARLALYARWGHRVASLCEENVIYTYGQDYCNRKMGPTSIQRVDLVFTAGEFCAAHLREFRPAVTDKIRITGNPRFDTLLPDIRTVYEESAEAIRRRTGRFLLVNTNFGSVNPLEPEAHTMETYRRRGKIADDEHAAMVARHRAYKARHMERFRGVLSQIAMSGAFERIILRPHPVENQESWREWLGPLGVEIRYEGNANEWMLAAEAILHTGCTTGIEALLLDRPVATYVMDDSSEFLNIADSVSVQVGSAEEFLATVANWRELSRPEFRRHLAPQRTRLQKYIDSVQPPLAADRILDALDELNVPQHDVSSSSFRQSVKSQAGKLIRAGTAILRTVRHGVSVDAQKCPPLSMNELKRPIEIWLSAGVLSREPRLAKMGRRFWLLQ